MRESLNNRLASSNAKNVTEWTESVESHRKAESVKNPSSLGRPSQLLEAYP